MNTAIQHKPSTLLSRRRVLKLAVASVLLISGCAGTPDRSDLDTAMSDLSEVLDQIDANGTHDKLVSIARQIQNLARKLAVEHQSFIDNFERLLNEYDTTEAQLKQLIETHASKRVSKRNDLLHLQDELHAAMTPDEWARVVQVLNEAGNALAGYSLAEI